MRPTRRTRSLLVPILDGDITKATLVHARAVLASSGARLALVHVVSARQPAHGTLGERVALDDVGVPRWRQLAATLPPDRVFVDAVLREGDPAEAILSQARRFGSDLILLDQPTAQATTAHTSKQPSPYSEVSC